MESLTNQAADIENKNVISKNKGKEQDSLKNDFNNLLSVAGEFGLYQVLLFLSTCPFFIFGAFSYCTQLFMTEVPSNHWCRVPQLEHLTDIERRSLAIPPDESDNFGYSHCTMYAVNWSSVSEMKPNMSWPIEPCKYGWEFNKSEIPYPTISTEMEWVCEKDNYQAIAQAIFFVGSIVGGLGIGWIADHFGRLPAGILGNLIGCIAGTSSIFTRNITEFSICRFFMGMSYNTCMIMICLLVIEYTAPKYRNIAANLPVSVFFTLGMITLPWIALACENWRTLSLVTSVPMAISLLAPIVIPESPTWLLSQGRIDEAVEKVLTIGRINKKKIPRELIEKFKLSATKLDTEKSASVLKIFRRPILRMILFLVSLEFMCCTIILDGLLRSIGTLDFDFFLSFTLLSFPQFPSLLIASFTLDLTGRKWITVIMMFCCCIFSILIALVPSGWYSILCAIVAIFCVYLSYTVTLQWAAEMLPTCVRGFGSSIVQICGYIGTVISPFIAYLKVYITVLPLIIVGIIAAIGTVAALFLPETAGRNMPETFEEAEDLVKNQKFFHIPFLRKS
ncbi:unnamed protein product, partial [Brenthis ino]